MTSHVSGRAAHAVPSLDARPELPPASVASGEQAAARGSRRYGRLVAGLAAVAGSLALSLYFVVFTATSEAVVTGRVVTLPTPISGTVVELTGEAGDLVEAGDVVARVKNERADGGRLDALRTQRAGLRARLEAVHAEIAHKTTERTRLIGEIDAYRRQLEADFDHQSSEARFRLDAATTLLSQRERELSATAALHAEQLIARLEFERVRTEVTVAAQRREELQSAAVRLERRLDVLRRGTFVGADTPPEKLRVHDLALSLSMLSLSARELGESLATVEEVMRAEEVLVGRLSAAAIVSPVRGRIWKRSASAGQFVSAGSNVLELVDPSTVRVEAYFHQRYLRDITVGDAVRVMPVGSSHRLAGTIQWIGAEAPASAPTVAPQWRPDQDTPMRVVIELDAPGRQRVFVGQRSRVVVPPSTVWSLATHLGTWFPL